MSRYRPYRPAPAAPRKELAPHQRQAWAAFARLRDRDFGSGTQCRRWLAEEMGIEDRYCIIADMDPVECETVVAICDERIQQLDAELVQIQAAADRRREGKTAKRNARRRRQRAAKAAGNVLAAG